MIPFHYLIENRIATEDGLLNDMQSVVKNPDVHGDIPGKRGWMYCEGELTYGRMRIEMKLNPQDGVYDIQEAFMISIRKKTN